jgi:hypothetical protein
LNNKLKKRSTEDNERLKIQSNKRDSFVSKLNESLTNIEGIIFQRNKIATKECDNILRMIQAIERHTDYGRHNCGTRTVTDFLAQIKYATIGLKEILSSPDTPSKSKSASQSNTSQSWFDSTMLEMCKTLEEENIRLKERLEELEISLAQSQKEATLSKLVPHYRLAIVR